jgi:hypothetical protein
MLPKTRSSSHPQQLERDSNSNLDYRAPMEQDRRRSVVKKFIQQAKSSYGGPGEDGKIVGDPFLTSAYVRGARRMGFEQGNDAVEESLRRKIDPATTSVSFLINYINL